MKLFCAPRALAVSLQLAAFGAEAWFTSYVVGRFTEQDPTVWVLVVFLLTCGLRLPSEWPIYEHSDKAIAVGRANVIMQDNAKGRLHAVVLGLSIVSVYLAFEWLARLALFEYLRTWAGA